MAPKTSGTAAAAAETVAPAIAISGAAMLPPLPARKVRGAASKYPFDTLTAVGMAFGITGKVAKNLNSVINGANKKAVRPVLNDAGQPTFEMVDQGGMLVPNTQKPITEVTAKYAARDVTPDIAPILVGTPFEGCTVLIERVA